MVFLDSIKMVDESKRQNEITKETCFSSYSYCFISILPVISLLHINLICNQSVPYQSYL